MSVDLLDLLAETEPESPARVLDRLVAESRDWPSSCLLCGQARCGGWVEAFKDCWDRGYASWKLIGAATHGDDALFFARIARARELRVSVGALFLDVSLTQRGTDCRHGLGQYARPYVGDYVDTFDPRGPVWRGLKEGELWQ